MEEEDMVDVEVFDNQNGNTVSDTESLRKQRKEQSKKKSSKSTISVFRAKLTLDSNPPSPANLQCTRSAVLSFDSKEFTSVIASNTKLYCVKGGFLDSNSENTLISNVQEQLIAQTPDEIQSVSYLNDTISLVDAAGNVFLQSDSFKHSFNVRNNRGFETCWNGIEMNPSKASEIAVASMLNKTISIYDIKEQKMIQYNTPNYPTNLKYITLSGANEPLLAVTEYNQLSVWDYRSNSCIKRIQVSPSALYAIAFHNEMLASAGAQRAVYTFDCRKWSLYGTWTNCLKYEVTSLHFSQVNPQLLYVAGMDSGVVLGEFKANSGGSSVNTFLGDARWLGLQKFAHSETFTGFTEAGTLYCLRYNEDQIREATGSHKTAAHFSDKEERHKKIKG